MFGESWFENHGVDWQSVPHDLSFASYPAARYEPHERYALLYAAEHMAMKKTGKRAQYEAAAASGDALAALYQDFDWADEVLHVHLGSPRAVGSCVQGFEGARRDIRAHLGGLRPDSGGRSRASRARTGGTSSTPAFGLVHERPDTTSRAIRKPRLTRIRSFRLTVSGERPSSPLTPRREPYQPTGDCGDDADSTADVRRRAHRTAFARTRVISGCR